MKDTEADTNGAPRRGSNKRTATNGMRIMRLRNVFLNHMDAMAQLSTLKNPGLGVR
jgi:hypothetical protein